jgi:hypothetical protein
LELNPVDLKNALAILIHHNFLTFSTKDKDSTEKVEKKSETYFYELLPNNVLMRYRIGYFTSILEDFFPSESKLIIQELVENGRLTKDQVLVRITEKYKINLENLEEEGDNPSPEKFKKNMATIFEDIVKSRYLSRVERIDKSFYFYLKFR